MIKTIPVSKLELGMFIHDLNCGWLDHPFARNRFQIDDVAILNKMRDAGVAEVQIDTDLGVVVSADEPNKAGADKKEAQACEPSVFPPLPIASLSPSQRFSHVKKLCVDANRLMQDMMRDVRLGTQVEFGKCAPVVDNILDAMFGFPSAFLPLVQVKNRDEYTFQHSVSVAALAVAFGRVLGMPRDEIKELAMGGLLHDVGKAQVPGHILNKPGKLDEAEFATMKNHAVNTIELLKDAKGVSRIAFDAAVQHHERYDGTGYPKGLKGGEISVHGQMLAIVDVYDAITSIRVYHKGIPPTEALKRLFDGRGTHFNPRLVEAFIKGVGIDLAVSSDKIKSHESFEKWGIDQARWVTAPV